MSDLNALLAGIIMHPDDDTRRLVYADALDEMEPVRVKCTSGMCGFDAKPGYVKVNSGRNYVYGEPRERKCNRCDGTGTVLDTSNAARAAFIRAQVAGVKDLFDIATRATSTFPVGWLHKRASDKNEYDKPTMHVGRGFGERLRCSAENFLKHADALIWHPEQTAECPQCKGAKGYWDDGGCKYQSPWWCECKACSGSGRVPRPCPDTAQPIRKVVLTTLPGIQSNGSGWRLRGESQFNGPFRPHRKIPVGVNGSWREALPLLLKAEWPGITFTLPATSPVVIDPIPLPPGQTPQEVYDQLVAAIANGLGVPAHVLGPPPT